MKIKEMISKYFGQITNTKGLLVILLIGVALLAFAGTPANNDKSKKTEEKQQGASMNLEYAKELEARLSKILSSVRGASDVSVMVTLEDGGQSYYAQNAKTENKTSGAGEGMSVTGSNDDSYVLKNDTGGGQSALLVKSKLPNVSGVLITARGADSAEVKNNLVSAVKAVLDVKAHRVVVLSK